MLSRRNFALSAAVAPVVLATSGCPAALNIAVNAGLTASEALALYGITKGIALEAATILAPGLVMAVTSAITLGDEIAAGIQAGININNAVIQLVEASARLQLTTASSVSVLANNKPAAMMGRKLQG